MGKKSYLSSVFVADIWPELSKELKKSSKYYYSEINSLTNFLKKDILEVTFADCSLYSAHLDDLQLNKLINEKTKYKKLIMINKVCSLINNLANYNIQNGFSSIIFEQPDDDINLETIPNLGVIDRIIGYLAENDLSLLCAVCLSLKTYLKTSEFINLQISDIIYINDQHKAIRIDHDGEVRYNELTDDLYNILIKYSRQLINTKYLFPNSKKDGIISARTLQNRLKQAFKNIGTESYTFNNLRTAGILNSFSNDNIDLTSLKASMNVKTNIHLTRYNNKNIPFNKNYVNIYIKDI